MRPLDEAFYLWVRSLVGDGATSKILRSYGHIADYSIIVTIIIFVMVYFYFEKQYVKGAIYIMTYMVALIILEGIKMLIGFHIPVPHQHEEYYEFFKPTTGSAAVAIFTAAVGMRIGNRRFNIVFASVLYTLCVIGRICSGANYITEILVGMLVSIPTIAAFVYLNYEIELLNPPRRRKDDLTSNLIAEAPKIELPMINNQNQGQT